MTMEHIVKVQPKALVTSNSHKTWPSAACESGWIATASVPQSLASLVLNARIQMVNAHNRRNDDGDAVS